jgi:hypothetical protein
MIPGKVKRRMIMRAPPRPPALPPPRPYQFVWKPEVELVVGQPRRIEISAERKPPRLPARRKPNGEG